LKALRKFSILFVLFAVCLNSYSQQKTNLEVIQELSIKTIDSLVSQGSELLVDTLNVKMIPSDDYRIVENSILKRLHDNRRLEIVSDTNTLRYTTLELSIIKMGVRYNNVFYDGFFGSKKVVRSVNLELTSKVTKNGSLKNIDILNQQYQDTVDYNSINLIENQNIVSTISSLPDDTFIDRLLSPVIITSSVAVVVYLFFTLRK
jgi:hypothetical protein